MKPINGFKIRHICSIPFCRNRDTTIFSRSSDIGFGQKVYICADCAKDMAAYYKSEAKKNAGKDGKSDDNGSNSQGA